MTHLTASRLAEMVIRIIARHEATASLIRKLFETREKHTWMSSLRGEDDKLYTVTTTIEVTLEHEPPQLRSVP